MIYRRLSPAGSTKRSPVACDGRRRMGSERWSPSVRSLNGRKDDIRGVARNRHKLYGTLLNRNLPPGATWVDGKDLRDWVRKNAPDAANSTVDPPGVTVKQTSDGKFWCVYRQDSFLLCTPQGFERFLRLNHGRLNSEKEP